MASTDRKTGGIKAIRLRRAGPDKPKKIKQSKPTATQMTFFEHLGELRNRLMWSSIAVVICTAVAWFFSKDILQAFLDLANPAIAAIKAQGFPAPEFVQTDLSRETFRFILICPCKPACCLPARFWSTTSWLLWPRPSNRKLNPVRPGTKKKLKCCVPSAGAWYFSFHW